MSKLVEIVKKYVKYEVGYNEFPAIKRVFTGSRVKEGDGADSTSFIFKYGLAAREVLEILGAKHYLAQTNSKSDDLEIILKTAIILGTIEAVKYFGDKVMRYLVNEDPTNKAISYLKQKMTH